MRVPQKSVYEEERRFVSVFGVPRDIMHRGFACFGEVGAAGLAYRPIEPGRAFAFVAAFH
jgi:hypothetical protein